MSQRKKKKLGRPPLPKTKRAVRFSTSVPADQARWLRTVGGVEGAGARIVLAQAYQSKA